MGKTDNTRQSFFRRIAKDTTANTIAISAASILPLLAMVGGGVDASRFYMAETRLQAACDAGALAGRRAMADGQFTTAAVSGDPTPKAIADNFFEQNYNDGLFGTENLTHTFTATNDGEVLGTATGTIPTSIMGAFGYDEFDLSVDCQADINISNTDIMFVIDITGSMNCAPNNPGGGNCGNSPDPGSKIEGMQEAVMTFYDTVETATSSSAQVRYGVVPYASNVNVGAELLAENPNWLATSHTYQSRYADPIITYDYEPESYDYVRTGDGFNYEFQERTEENFFDLDNIDQCRDEINSRADIFVSDDPSNWTQVSQVDGDPRITTYTGRVTYEQYQFDGGFWYGSSGRCQLFYNHTEYEAESTITFTEDRTEQEEFRWTYDAVEFTLTSLYDDNRMTLPLGNNGSDTTVVWDGCVEEAATVNVASFNPITPTGAFDLDINLVPATPAERWKPVLDDVVWRRETGGSSGNSNNDLNPIVQQAGNERRPSYDCTTPAFRLRTIDRSDMQTFVDSLQARGNTYHDIGMIWGGRFISPKGIFAGDNASAPNGDAIGRHIVFMTDGLLVPNVETYGMYGVEWWDRRVTDSNPNGEASARHAERFQAACRAARAENISVWVVAFGTDLTQNLVDCATPGRAFQAGDTATLDARFKEIAQQIAALRLTQ